MKHLSSNNIKCFFLICKIKLVKVLMFLDTTSQKRNLQKIMVCNKSWSLPPDLDGSVGFARFFCKLLVAICQMFVQHMQVWGPSHLKCTCDTEI